MKNIEYINRYREHIVLEHIGRNVFAMPMMDYCRIGTNEDGSLAFVDPSGGPFLEIGTLLNDKKHIIQNISEDGANNRFIFTTKIKK